MKASKPIAWKARKSHPPPKEAAPNSSGKAELLSPKRDSDKKLSPNHHRTKKIMKKNPKKRSFPTTHIPSMTRAKPIPKVVTSTNRWTKEVEACLQGNIQKAIAQDPEIRKKLWRDMSMKSPPLLLSHIQKYPKRGKGRESQNLSLNTARKQKKASHRKQQKMPGDSSSMCRLPKIPMRMKMNLNYHRRKNLKLNR